MPGFFDKMKSGVTGMAMEATVRSKEAFETQQVKTKIGELEGQRKLLLAQIGEAVLAMYKSSSFDQEALSQPCQAVLAVDGQIAERETELEEIHKRAEAALAEHGAVAATQVNTPEATGAAGAFCGNCGTPLKGAKFCPSCGTKAP